MRNIANNLTHARARVCMCIIKMFDNSKEINVYAYTLREMEKKIIYSDYFEISCYIRAIVCMLARTMHV